MTDRFPQNQSGKNSLALFLDAADKLPMRSENSRQTSGRLLFALDATASRQPSWDRACQLQGQMWISRRKKGDEGLREIDQ